MVNKSVRYHLGAMAASAPDRSRFAAALSRVHADRLASVANALTDRFPLTVTSLPVSGLAMLRLRESVNGDPFNLGEIPLAMATVELDLNDGRRVPGGAYIMADDVDLAVWIAICDAAYSAEIPGLDDLQLLLDEGYAELQKDQDIRQSMLDRTRVRFALLNEGETP